MKIPLKELRKKRSKYERYNLSVDTINKFVQIKKREKENTIMEKIFDGMVSEEELVELSGTKQDESGAGFPWEIVIELVTDFICPTGGCTPRCAK